MAIRNIEPAIKWVSIEVATVVPTCRAVYIGVAGNYDFTFDGGTTWVLFSGCAAGSILPIAASGARDADDSAPEAGDIVFLY